MVRVRLRTTLRYVWANIGKSKLDDWPEDVQHRILFLGLRRWSMITPVRLSAEVEARSRPWNVTFLADEQRSYLVVSVHHRSMDHGDVTAYKHKCRGLEAWRRRQ